MLGHGHRVREAGMKLVERVEAGARRRRLSLRTVRCCPFCGEDGLCLHRGDGGRMRAVTPGQTMLRRCAPAEPGAYGGDAGG